MPQILAPVNYVNGQTVDATGFNNHVNGAIVLPGIITDWSAIPANTIVNNDLFLLYDVSSTSLKKAGISDILNSNLGITTSSIVGGAGSNINIAPASGYLVTITSGATFEGNVAVTGTLSSTGNATVGGNLTVNGTTATLPAVTASTVSTTSNATIGGNLTVTGTIIQAGGIIDKTLYDIVEYTISDQDPVSGDEHNLDNGALYYTTPVLTKPAGEIWVFQFTGICKLAFDVDGNTGNPTTVDYLMFLRNSTSNVDYFKTYFCASPSDWKPTASDPRNWNIYKNVEFLYLSQASETFSTSIQLRVASNGGYIYNPWQTHSAKIGVSSVEIPKYPQYWTSGYPNVYIPVNPGKLRIFKYKA